MKKLISILLCVALLAMIPMQALAAQGDVIVARSQDGLLQSSIEASCAMGDALYMIPYGDGYSDGRTLAVHRVGETEMTKYPIEIGEPIDDYSSYDSVTMLSNGEKVYVLRQVTNYSNDVSETRAELYEVSIDGDVATASLVCEPDWSTFQTEDGYYSYVEAMIFAGEYIIAWYYDGYGNQAAARMKISDGKFEPCTIEGSLISLTAYLDGKALIQEYTDDECANIRFLTYDPATDSTETLSEMEVEQYDRFTGLACDPNSGKLYYVREGEIFELNLETGESGEALTDMPLEFSSDATVAVLDGEYYAAASYDSYCLRNLHPAQKPTQRLKIYDNSYEDNVSNAFYAFANEHSDASVVISRDYSAQESLVEDMMNRSSDVDVYIVSASSSDYEAVFDRGYIAELTESEKLQAVADRMYPAMRDALSVNGQLCAIPVNFTFWMPFLREEGLEKLGLTVEDVPTNWSDFLDFLIDLQQKMPEDGSVSLMDPWTADTYAKESMFTQIFATYQQTLNVDPNAFSTDQMAQLLQKLEQVDFHALGQPTEEETNDDNFYAGDGNAYLLELNMGTSICGISAEDPLVMSLTADTPALLAVSCNVAFVNPFSENRELALEFVEKLAESLPYYVEYVLYSDMTQPYENEYYQQGLENMQQYVENLRKQYEEAEEADKQDIQQQIDWAEEELAGYEKYRYSVSEEDVAWIHNNADALAIKGSDWLYSDDSGDAYELVRQYCEGQIDAKKLMDEIGRKIQMMMMEGY